MRAGLLCLLAVPLLGQTFRPLHVTASGIVADDSGKPALLRGLNRSATGSGNADATATEADYAAQNQLLSMNLVRIFVNAAWWNANLTVPIAGQPYQSYIDTLIQRAKKYGNYVVVLKAGQFPDPPCGADGKSCPAPDQGDLNCQADASLCLAQDTTGNSIDAAFTFWAAFAKKYAADPAVLYDTWEDMHGIDAGTWSDNQNQLIAAIRTWAPQSLVFVEDTGTAFESIVSGALADFAWSNLVWNFHLYNASVSGCTEPASPRTANWPQAIDPLVNYAQAHGHAAAIMEWGGCNDGEPYHTNITSYARNRQVALAYFDSSSLLAQSGGAYQLTATGAKVAQAYTAIAAAGSGPAPAITLVANAEGASPAIAPNTWVEIKGSNLAPAGDSRIWRGSDFVNGQMPTKLDGVSVTVNGKAAFVYYISPTQINILTPPDVMSGSVQVAVNNNGAAVSAAAQAQTLSPSFFVFGDGQHVAAVHADGSLLGPSSLSVPGYTFTPAKPGETVLVYANGFGATNVPLVAGSSTQSGTLTPTPTVTIGGVTATLSFAGLVSPGLFQFNVVIPLNAPGGDEPITATYNGATTQAGTLLAMTGTAPPTSVTYYVAPNGNDSWSGTLASPNAAGTDGPFATLDHARAAVQTLNKAGLTQITVQVRAGTYCLPSTIQFTAADSGSPSLNITYQNYPGESPVISGGVRLTNWTNTGGNVWKTTLPASTQYFENLFYNGERRLRPRLGGYLGTYYRVADTVYLNSPAPPAAAPEANCSVYISGKGWECFDRFLYNPADPVTNAWKNLAPPTGNACGQPAGNSALTGDIELVIFEKFYVGRQRISCVDTTKHIIYLTGPTVINAGIADAVGFIPQHRYVIENIEDQLTQPGQWFLDRSTTPWTLTYLAGTGENPNNDSVIMPQLEQILVASNLQYATFQGLTIEYDNFTVPAVGFDSDDSRSTAAVSFQNSQHITLDSDTVAHTSANGLDFISCINAQSNPSCVSRNTNAVTANNIVQNSAFYDVGISGIRIGTPGINGDSNANVPQFITVQNNVVEGFGRVFPAAKGIIQGDGHDNLYTHNDVYDGYHGAISICFCSGVPGLAPLTNNITVSFNHVYNLIQGIMNDGGSIYFRTSTAATNPPSSGTGNKMLNNRVHDVSDSSILDADGYGGDGLYIDDITGLVDVENNLVYRVSGSGLDFSGSRAGPNQSSTIKNNIFAFARLSLIHAANPYAQTAQFPAPMFFTASNNLFYFDRSSASSPSFYAQGGCVYDGGVAYTSFEQWDRNLYWRTDGGFANDPNAFHVLPNPVSPTNICFGNAARAAWINYPFTGWQKLGEDVQSVVLDPGFKNPAYPADDYSLPNGSPGVGFVPFDPTQAGRTNPVINPPAVPATFPTKTFSPKTDF